MNYVVKRHRLISRILFTAIIYLALSLLKGSSCLPIMQSIPAL